MGCDIHAFVEIESSQLGEFDSLVDLELVLPRNYQLFGALAGVRSDISPLFPPRGIPSGLGASGFSKCYRRIIEHTNALGYRGERFILPYEVAGAQIFPDSISPRWGVSSLGYVAAELETASWLTLAELRSALRHASLIEERLEPEYQFVLSTMERAESLLSSISRLVFWFDSV